MCIWGLYLETYPITPEGFLALQDELKHLKTVVRPQVVNDLAEARAHGDLSENAEYDAAKEKQGLTESRIRQIESRLSRCRVVDPKEIKSEKVAFGATVSIYDCNADRIETWKIVGEDEADSKKQQISILSPLAKALIGKSVGDVVEIRTPKGIRECEITGLEYR